MEVLRYAAEWVLNPVPLCRVNRHLHRILWPEVRTWLEFVPAYRIAVGPFPYDWRNDRQPNDRTYAERIEAAVSHWYDEDVCRAAGDVSEEESDPDWESAVVEAVEAFRPHTLRVEMAEEDLWKSSAYNPRYRRWEPGPDASSLFPVIDAAGDALKTLEVYNLHRPEDTVSIEEWTADILDRAKGIVAVRLLITVVDLWYLTDVYDAIERSATVRVLVLHCQDERDELRGDVDDDVLERWVALVPRLEEFHAVIPSLCISAGHCHLLPALLRASRRSVIDVDGYDFLFDPEEPFVPHSRLAVDLLAAPVDTGDATRPFAETVGLRLPLTPAEDAPIVASGLARLCRGGTKRLRVSFGWEPRTSTAVLVALARELLGVGDLVPATAALWSVVVDDTAEGAEGPPPPKRRRRSVTDADDRDARRAASAALMEWGWDVCILDD